MRARTCARTCARNETEKVLKKQRKTAAKPEAANGIRKKERSFYTDKEELLRFRYEKPTVPQRKTYGSHGGNIHFAKGKHKNYGNITRFSTQGLQKNWLQMKKLIRFFRQEQENTPSRKGIKKGVPLNSNLC